MNKYPPECPFCGRYINRPVVTMTEFGEVLSGRCICSAIYVCDPTGHNAGEAYMEAMALAKGDWDIDSMNPDTDYKMADFDYDLKNHVRLYSTNIGEGGGKLIFVKLTGNMTTEIKQDVVNKEKGSHLSKAELRNLLANRRYDEIVETANNDKGILRRLISLTYDKTDEISWRAMEVIGKIAGEFSKSGKTEIIRDIIRRLLWSMGEESGGIGWSSPEMLGEIIRANPEEFSDIIPILWSFHEEEMFRSGIIWAMGRIGSVRPALVNFVANEMKSMLIDKDPYVRGYAAWFFYIVHDKESMIYLRDLLNDQNRINFYQDGNLIEMKVADIIKAVIDKNVK